MAAFEDNYVYSDYVSDDGNTYSIRTLADAAADSGLALTTTSTHPAYGPRSRRHSPRLATFADLTAPGRRVTYPIGTAAAFTTLTASLGSTPATHARRVRGEVAAKTYTLVATHAEKVGHHVILSSAAQGT
jgi:hypothetical protein